jgi:hypothetical protein
VPGVSTSGGTRNACHSSLAARHPDPGHHHSIAYLALGSPSIAAEITPEFQRGWDAALQAARAWHEGQASKATVQARRSRFPKNLEREAEVHRKSAERIVTLSPDDV